MSSLTIQTPPMWKRRPAPPVPTAHVQVSSSLPPETSPLASLSSSSPLPPSPPLISPAPPAAQQEPSSSSPSTPPPVQQNEPSVSQPQPPAAQKVESSPPPPDEGAVSPTIEIMEAMSAQIAYPQLETATSIAIESVDPIQMSIQVSLHKPSRAREANSTDLSTLSQQSATEAAGHDQSDQMSLKSNDSFKKGETPKKSRQAPIENFRSPNCLSFDENGGPSLKPQPVMAAPKPAAAGIKFTEMNKVFIGKTSIPKEEELQSFVDSVVHGRTDLSHTIDPSEIGGKTTRIGSGASGTVFKALYKGRYVAVKRFSPDNITFDRTEIVREAALMSILDHPNLVEYIGSCLNPRNMFIVTDLYPTNLQSVVFNKTLDLTLVHVLRIALGISNGMRFLHSLGLIHRDLKCANVLLTSDLDAKITDFGTTRIVPRERGMMTGGMGTLEYMAPEILSHQIYSTKADVFSFAIVLWQMVSRKEPYEELSIFTLPEHVCKGSRPPIPPGCPQKLALLIKSCWNSKQNARPDFSEICRMLQVIAGLSPDTSSATSEYFKKCGVLPPGISATTITELQAGSVLLKCGRTGKPHFSLFQLSADSTFIQWTSKTKDPSKSRIAINSIREMCLGQLTPVFARSGMESYSHLSFSLIAPERSVDIICTTAEEFKVWTTGIRTLLPIGARFRSGSVDDPGSSRPPSNLADKASSQSVGNCPPAAASSIKQVSTPVVQPANPSPQPSSSSSSAAAPEPSAQSDDKKTINSPPLNSSSSASSAAVPPAAGSSASAAPSAISSPSESRRKSKGAVSENRRRSLSVGSGQQLFMRSSEPQKAIRQWSADKIKATRSEKNVNVYSACMKKVLLSDGSGGYAPMTLELNSELVGKDVCHVAAGKLHYAALTSQGTLYMWGDNTFGQQGVPQTHPRTRSNPIQASMLASSSLSSSPSPVLAFPAVGPNPRNDSSPTPGSGGNDGGNPKQANASKSVFSNIVSNVFIPETLPLHIVPLGPAVVQSVACGKDHTVCLTVDGVVYSWGKNSKGELGLGDTAERYVPTVVESLRANPVIIIACGKNTSAAYTDDGTLYMWGQNDTFQLAREGGGHVATPLVIPYDLSTPKKQQQDESEKYQANVGGYNDDFDDSRQSSTASTPLTVFRKNVQLAKRIKSTGKGPKDDTSVNEQIEEIALGQYHSAVLTTFGTIWVWGKLGNLIEKQPKITNLPNGVGGVQISSGDYHMAAIGDDEHIYTWGDGNLGQLGRGISEFSPIPKPVIGPFSRMKPQQVFCSGSYTAVVTEEGNLYGFGYGSAGKWNTTEESLPNSLAAFKSKKVLKLGCGPNEILAIVTQRDTPDERLTGWVPDDEAKCCMACKEPFTHVKRRHHCRKCEGVFCGNCSRYKTPILSKGFAKPVRVCLNCFSALTTLISKK